MRPLFLVLAMVCLCRILPAQYIYTIKADSVKITNNCDTAELIIENHTQNVLGFLYNKGKGRTEFRKVQKLNDSTLVFGEDTLIIQGSSPAGGATPQIQYNNNGQLAGTSGMTWDEANNGITLTINDLGTSIPTNGGIILKNSTPAENNLQQNSPPLIFVGQGWKTTVPGSQEVAYSMHTLPVQHPAGIASLVVYKYINGTRTTHPVFQIETEGIRVSNGNVSGLGGISLNANVTPIKDIFRVGNRFTFRGNTDLGLATSDGIWQYNTLSYNPTSGTANYFVVNPVFEPESGTAEYSTIVAGGEINQTGGANGITRGLYVNPSLVSAVDFRAIETVAGNVVLNTASGNTGIGVTSPVHKLHVGGSGFFSDSLMVTNLPEGTHSDSVVVWNSGTKVLKRIAQYKISNTIYRVSISDDDYTAIPSDYLLAFVSLTNSRTVTLPVANTMPNKTLIIKDESGSAATHNITVDGFGSETIDGATTKVINTNYGWVTVYSNGSDWFTISQ